MMRYNILNKKYTISAVALNGQLLIAICIFLFASCKKVEYTEVNNPAYLRVFNSLLERNILGTDQQSSAYLCLLINPELDASGTPTGAEIVGDFLDKRETYASANNVNIGISTTTNNVEYPGKNIVPVAPIINGYDLSNWAQVPSGQAHVMFMYRPKNSTPFFQLSGEQRSKVMVDTVLSLEAGEVYTLQALLLDFQKNTRGVVLRQENFYKQNFFDDLVYVNFYNYSAKGFWQAPDEDKKSAPSVSTIYEYYSQVGIKDEMDVYFSLYTGKRGFRKVINTPDYAQGIVFEQDDENGETSYEMPDADVGFNKKYLASIKHDNFSGNVMPYSSFSLWNDSDTTGKIYTDQWQRFYFVSPEMNIEQIDYSDWTGYSGSSIAVGIEQNPKGSYAYVNCLSYNQRIYNSVDWLGSYQAAQNLPSLVISTHSSNYNPRSFATVNSFEIINGNIYLTTIQRKYDPPVYRD